MPAPQPGVDQLQQRLNRLDYRDAAGRALPVDGVFGERTAEALVEFQRAHGLRADGVPGPRTLAALYPAGAAPPAGHAGAGPDAASGRVAQGRDGVDTTLPRAAASCAHHPRPESR